MINLENKNIILTGATGGIGNAIVDTLVSLKANLIVTGTNEKKLDEIHNRVKEKIQSCVDFAESSPFPQKEDSYKDVYKEDYNFIID